MELEHLHVLHDGAGAVEHGDAVDGLFRAGSVKPVVRGTAAGGDQGGGRLGHNELTAPHIEQKRAGDHLAGFVQEQFDGAALLHHGDLPLDHLLGEPAENLDARQVALVYGAIKGLAGKRLLVDRSVRVAVEEAAELGFHLLDGGCGLLDQRLGQLLVVDVLAALEGVHQVLLVGVP